MLFAAKKCGTFDAPRSCWKRSCMAAVDRMRREKHRSVGFCWTEFVATSISCGARRALGGTINFACGLARSWACIAVGPFFDCVWVSEVKRHVVLAVDGADEGRS